MIAYRLSPAAEVDLVGIWDYTAQQWDKDQAARYVLAIRDRLDGIVAGRIPLRSAVRILHQSMDVAGVFRDGR